MRIEPSKNQGQGPYKGEVSDYYGPRARKNIMYTNTY